MTWALRLAGFSDSPIPCGCEKPWNTLKSIIGNAIGAIGNSRLVGRENAERACWTRPRPWLRWTRLSALNALKAPPFMALMAFIATASVCLCASVRRVSFCLVECAEYAKCAEWKGIILHGAIAQVTLSPIQDGQVSHSLIALIAWLATLTTKLSCCTSQCFSWWVWSA